MNTNTGNIRLAGAQTTTSTGRTAPLRTAGALLAAAALALAATGTGAGAAQAMPETAAGPPSDAAGRASSALVLVDRAPADVDADGTLDLVLLKSADRYDGGRARIVVRWGSGGSGSVRFSIGANPRLGNMTDIDLNGDLEIAAVSGGGDAVRWDLVTLEQGSLAKVTTIDASTRPAQLRAVAETRGYNTIESAGGGYLDYRFSEWPTGAAPAPVTIRDWELSGTTLTRSAHRSNGCWVELGDEFGLIRESC